MATVCLVLEGGGLRGVFSAGVLDYFDDRDLIFKSIVGVSAGACNSVSYVSRQRGRNVEINTRFCNDKRYLDVMSVFKTGEAFKMDFLFDDIPNKYIPFDYDRYEKEVGENLSVVTNMRTGKPEYCPVKSLRTDSDFVRASSSIPMFSKIVTINGEEYLDGGIADSIPVEYAAKHYDKVVAVLTQAEGFVKTKNKLAPICKAKYGKKYPEFVKTFENRHNNYNASVKYAEKLEAEGRAVVIRPSEPPKVGNFEKNPDNLWALHQQGYEQARAMYNKIIDLCKDCDNVELIVK